MPSHVVDILMRTIDSKKGSKENLDILILGVSYKSDVNDHDILQLRV
ncbi:hypothetical protein BH18THE1_BH18THE1_22720 [soil metagenome]